MRNNKHILFVHIPKTAGTSFRIAAEEYFGKENTFYDYSPKAEETSKEVIDCIYDINDPYKLYSKLSKLDHSFLSGHFPTAKYAVLYDTLNVVSFVRDPIEQIISHYNHLKNHNRYEKNLIDFVKEPRFRDLQSRNLAGKPICLYGFLGITEEYNVSIDLFNALYDTNLPHKHINIKKKGSLNVEDIDEKIKDQIKQIHIKDIEFYTSVRQQFKIRKELYRKNLPFTYGFIQKITEKQIAGLAFQKDNDEALEIDIYTGDKYLETVLAKNLRPGQRNVPRKGFIGFDYTHQGDETLSGELHAYIKNTGQEIV